MDFFSSILLSCLPSLLRDRKKFPSRVKFSHESSLSRVSLSLSLDGYYEASKSITLSCISLMFIEM